MARKTEKVGKFRNVHCRTWNMARKQKIMENEKHPLDPAGERTEIAPPFPPRTFSGEEPGIYRLIQADGEGNLTETAFGINGRNGLESSLLPTGEAAAYEDGETKTVSMGRNIRNGVLLLLLLVLAIEWRVNCRGD